MPSFSSSFSVEAPLSQVAAFHQDDIPRAFAGLTPPGSRVVFADDAPTKMIEGTVLEFTLYLGGFLPVQWRARHHDVSMNGFTDTQEKGPLPYWEHRHEFKPDMSTNNKDPSRTTVVEDRIQYEYGPLCSVRGMINRVMFNPGALYFLFTWRAYMTRKMLVQEMGTRSELSEKLLKER